MAFPTEGWPPRVASGVRSIRFYKTGTATANFSDNAWLFAQTAGANPYTPLPEVVAGSNAPVVVPSEPGTGRTGNDPVAAIWSGTIRICNDGGGTLEYSFDGVNVHGVITALDQEAVYRNRYEAGICVRGASAVFRIEAW